MVGPVWRGGGSGEAEWLRACCSNALRLAETMRVHSLAFPAISAGAYGDPVEPAARIALVSVLAHVPIMPAQVVFCCFSEQDLMRYRSILDSPRPTR